MCYVTILQSSCSEPHTEQHQRSEGKKKMKCIGFCLESDLLVCVVMHEEGKKNNPGQDQSDYQTYTHIKQTCVDVGLIHLLSTEKKQMRQILHFPSWVLSMKISWYYHPQSYLLHEVILYIKISSWGGEEEWQPTMIAYHRRPCALARFVDIDILHINDIPLIQRFHAAQHHFSLYN